MRYNNRLRMQDLFMNPELAGVFPQFRHGKKLQNIYSYAEVEKCVAEYLANALNGTITGDGEITVRGKQKEVLARVRQLQALIEGFFNNMPNVVAGLKRNVSLYLPYATLKQLGSLQTTEDKIKAMQAVMDNFQYNTDLCTLNSVKHERTDIFAQNKRKWEAKVGYRRLRKV